MSDRNDEPDDSLERLGKRLDDLKSRRDGGRRAAAAERDSQGMAVGFRIAVELTAALVVGGFLGYMLDLWLGTAPLMLIVLLLVGSAAGFLQVYRTAMELERKAKEAKAKEAKAKQEAKAGAAGSVPDRERRG